MAIWDTDLTAGPGGHQLIAWTHERLAADPVTNLFVGREYFNTVSNRIRTYNGTGWDEYGTGAGAGDVVQTSNSARAGLLKVSAGANKTIVDSALVSGIIAVDANGVAVLATAGTDFVTGSSTNTFTNKTIDANGTGNSITNLEVADFASSAINATTALTSASDTQLPTALAVKTYVDNAVVGLYDDRGNYDASVNTFPASGGSGAAGAILKGDIWRISVAGTLGGADVQVGDTVRALVDTPAQTADNWALMQTNDVQATDTVVGNTRYATNAEAEAKTVTNAALTPSNLATFPQRFVQTFGDGTATSFTITHNFNTLDVVTQVRDASTNEIRYPQIVNTNVNSITISGYTIAPASNSMRVVVLG